ncbi:hypothetical protein [Brucella rhizosphaerae]|nr:hypothetical protein [Brucella rhizosphaerae]
MGMSFAIAAFPAAAENQTSYEGHYSNNNTAAILDANLVRKAEDRYSISLSTNVPIKENQPGCAGSIEGEINITGKTTTLSVANEGFNTKAKETAQNKRYCEISITFLNEYTMELQEVGGCSYYHGASCSFSGVVEHDASGI